MFADGLIAEVRSLQQGPKPIGPVPAQAVGYREVLDWLAGASRGDERELIGRIQARTRQLAKRQMTWFRGLSEVRLWPVWSDEPPQVTAGRLAQQLGRGIE
jgi:tRNA dimethylallyltransferase